MMVMVVAPVEVNGTVVTVVMVPLVTMAVTVAMVLVVLPVMVVVPRTMAIPLRRGGAGNQDERRDGETCETCLHGDDLPVRE
ncbi:MULTISPECIES: hypothetical protein [Methylobacterium]|nr:MULTISPECIES: hypothetical protein [Methylobacterium]